MLGKLAVTLSRAPSSWTACQLLSMYRRLVLATEQDRLLSHVPWAMGLLVILSQLAHALGPAHALSAFSSYEISADSVGKSNRPTWHGALLPSILLPMPLCKEQIAP